MQGDSIMNLPHDVETLRPSDENPTGMSRRSFFKRATVFGATSAVALGGLVSLASALDQDAENANHKDDHGKDKLAKGDHDILVAAEIAEALAVTTYSNIINIAPFFDRLPSDDQGYWLLQGRRRCLTFSLSSRSRISSLPSPHSFIPSICLPMHKQR
jgi:hypothetical protein